MNNSVMTPKHRLWDEYSDKLGVMFEVFGCDHSHDCTRFILSRMGGIDIEASLKFFENNGGYCDCEVGLKAQQSRTREVQRVSFSGPSNDRSGLL